MFPFFLYVTLHKYEINFHVEKLRGNTLLVFLNVIMLNFSIFSDKNASSRRSELFIIMNTNYPLAILINSLIFKTG